MGLGLGIEIQGSGLRIRDWESIKVSGFENGSVTQG